MKNRYLRDTQRGFTLMEMVVVMVVIAAILSAVLPAFIAATNNSKVTSTISSIRALQTASTNYYTSNGGSYTGGTLGTISMATLASNNMLPAKASGTNAWGGTIAVSPDANANYVDITLTRVPSGVQASLTNAVANLVSTTPTYTAGTLTWSAAF